MLILSKLPFSAEYALIFTKYLSRPNVVLMLFKILVLVKYTGNTAHDIYRGWIYCWYFSRYFSSLIMLIILFKILFLANILTLYFKGYFYQPNVLPILFKILFSGECSLGASWCAATWRSLSLCLLQQELNWKESKASQLQMGGE